MSTITIKPQREKPIKQHHPWIFSGAIDRIDASLQDGDIADIVSSHGEFLARGYVNRQSQIVVRLLTWDEAEAIDQEFWVRRLSRSISLRPVTSARRLVNAEADGLPGLIIDQYNDFCIAQFLTLGIDRHQQLIVSAVAEVLNPSGIYERSDVDVRAKEGLAQQTGVLRGAEPPELFVIEQDGLKFWVDVKRGHKTGFYLDQPEEWDDPYRFFRW